MYKARLVENYAAGLSNWDYFAKIIKLTGSIQCVIALKCERSYHSAKAIVPRHSVLKIR